MKSLIIFADIKALFFRMKWLVLGGALLFATVGVWKRGQLPLKYEIAATFKDSGGTQEAGGKLDTFLKTFGVYQEKNKGDAFFMSSPILEPTVERLGLQARIELDGIWEKKRRNFSNAWKIERKKRIKKRKGFLFENVHYSGEGSKNYEIFFTSRGSFEIRDTKDRFVCRGNVGEKVSFGKTSFTLLELPENLPLRTPYPLIFTPILEEVEKIRSNLEIEPVGRDYSILGLEFIYPDYALGKKILNTMMETYEGYLFRENQRISNAQMAYLEKRRDRFCAQVEGQLKEHAIYLKEKGGLALKQQLPLLQKEKEHYLGALRALELDRLGTPFQNRNELHHLCKERDALGLSLAEVEPVGPLFSPMEKKSFKGNARLTSLQEEIEKKRLTYGGERGEEYRGIDLAGARKLLLNYLEKRDVYLSKIQQLKFAKKELEGEGSEYISLAAAFPDPISQTMVQEMGALTQQLRKKRSLTEKERERVEKRLTLQKEDFLKHIDQTLTLTRLEKERTEERITSVERALLDLLGQEISLVEQQLEDQAEEKLAHLEEEKRLIEKALTKVTDAMKEVPDAWLKEEQLELSAEMNRGMLEALTQLVESKSIENNLKMLESKPLDYAYASPIPKAPLLKLFGVVGAFLGALITFAFCVLYYSHKGFPLTLRNLIVRGKKVIGMSENELETFRHLSLLIEKKLPTVAALVLGKGNDYTPSLAELLTKEGKKVLVIDLDTSKKSVPGLIHFLEGEAKAPTIEKKPFGDLISMGGNTPYINEALKREKFASFLKELKESYDVIFLPLQAGVTSALTHTFFTHADLMVLSLDGASENELAPYFAWEAAGNELAFIKLAGRPLPLGRG